MTRVTRIALLMCTFLLIASAAFVQVCDPKSVYIRVWNANVTDYPIGTAGDSGLTFWCILKDSSNAWAPSDTFTHADVGFEYDVSDGTYPTHTVHDISIQCGNFTWSDAPGTCWEAGDSVIVVATDAEDPYAGETNRYGIVLDSSSEQYEPQDSIAPSTWGEAKREFAR